MFFLPFLLRSWKLCPRRVLFAFCSALLYTVAVHNNVWDTEYTEYFNSESRRLQIAPCNASRVLTPVGHNRSQQLVAISVDQMKRDLFTSSRASSFVDDLLVSFALCSTRTFVAITPTHQTRFRCKSLANSTVRFKSIQLSPTSSLFHTQRGRSKSAWVQFLANRSHCKGLFLTMTLTFIFFYGDPLVTRLLFFLIHFTDSHHLRFTNHSRSLTSIHMTISILQLCQL